MADARVFKDRLGRPITDADGIDFRRVQQQVRRLTTVNLKKKPNLPWYAATTVGEVAAATKMPPARVLALWQDGYLSIVTPNDGAIDTWGLGEDGE